MIVVFWIALIGILGAIGVLIALIVKNKRTPRWGVIPTDHLQKKEVSIIARNQEKPYRGFLYQSTDFVESLPMPGMIVLPKRGTRYPAFEHWAAMLALQGFPVLAVELSDKKAPEQQYVDAVAGAVPAFKDVLVKTGKVIPSSIGIFGLGTSALAGVYASSTDPDVKIVCCSGMPKIDASRAKDVKGKIFIAQCKDDTAVPVEDFMHNKEVFGAGELSCLLLQYGGNDFIAQEAAISGFFSIAIHKTFKPRYKQFTPEGVVMP
nr:hypothetical protein [Candidatus Sigynarchaeota archaeon]